MKQYRRKIPLIFQDPFNALNPRMTVREILADPLEIHGIDYDEDKITETLERVELRPPDRFLDRVPGQLSGGQRQRVSIGRAIIVDPEIILADEPVSMLDVSTQASILKLLKNLVSDLGIPMIYISHDLSTVSYVCDEINVMYLGRIVERAPKKELLENPKHPYSRELINAVPIPDPYHNRVRTNLKQPAPDPSDLGSGCRFKNRCPKRMEICDETPMDVPLRDNRQVACHLHYDHEAYERSDGGALEDYVTSEKEGGLNDE
jgi:peptide/nickel transport system ATP-binding protein